MQQQRGAILNVWEGKTQLVEVYKMNIKVHNDALFYIVNWEYDHLVCLKAEQFCSVKALRPAGTRLCVSGIQWNDT